MKAEHPSSSEHKAITPPAPSRSPFKPSRPLLATAVIGAALITYQVLKTPKARLRLESLADMAITLGDLSEQDAAVVADLLARPTFLPLTQGEPRYVF